MEIFVTRLNKLLEENKITKYRLAKELGVSKQAVLWWCDGTNEPKISYLQKIACFFDVSSDYLLGLEAETGAIIWHKRLDKLHNMYYNVLHKGGEIYDFFFADER